MLKSIRLKNFKLHEDTSIEAAPITVFIGPNNSGKSSIFQALLLLRQAASRNDQFLCQPPPAHVPGPSEAYEYSSQLIIDVGNFNEVARRAPEDVHIEFSGIVHAKRALSGTERASVDVQLRVRENRLVFHAGSIGVSGTSAAWESVQDSAGKTPQVQVEGVSFFIQITRTFQFTAAGGYQPPSRATSYEAQLKYNDISQWLGGIPSTLLLSTHPVYALRGFEEWGYPITEFSPASLELLTLHDRALALPNRLASDRRLRERLSERLEELLHISIDFELVPGKRLKIWAKHTRDNGSDTLFANEGSGANQIPFLLVPVLLTPSNETVLLSEPEAHLHPKAQCELIRMLLTIAKKENIQFFIETHSEHVLHAILNAIGKREWKPDQVAIHSFDNVNGTAKVAKLEVDEQGGVKGGLPGFFDQSLDELSEYLETLKKPSK